MGNYNNDNRISNHVARSISLLVFYRFNLLCILHYDGFFPRKATESLKMKASLSAISFYFRFSELKTDFSLRLLFAAHLPVLPRFPVSFVLRTLVCLLVCE